MSTVKLSELKSFSERLETLRGNATKAAFAAKIGVSAPLYAQWMNGATPTYEKVRLIAKRLNVTADWLLTGREGVSTTLHCAFRDMLFEAKGATGLTVPELATRMGADVAEVNKIMQEGGQPSAALSAAFERHLQPEIDRIRKGDQPKGDPLTERLANIERLLVKLAGEKN